MGCVWCHPLSKSLVSTITSHSFLLDEEEAVESPGQYVVESHPVVVVQENDQSEKEMTPTPSCASTTSNRTTRSWSGGGVPGHALATDSPELCGKVMGGMYSTNRKLWWGYVSE